MKGACFCGAVSFEIAAETAEAYHCHCGICRKVTGSKFNTAFVVSEDQFKWTGSTDSIRSFQKDGKGFTHHFCSACGCTVPNRYQDVQFWVPAGLIEDPGAIIPKQHIFVTSKADWDEINDDLEQFDGYP